MSLRAWMMGMAVIAGAAAAGCRGQEQPAAPQEPLFKPIDPSQAAAGLGSPGVLRFSGTLPCADCAGIRTELTLVQDPQTGQPQTYVLSETQLGSMSTEGERTTTTSGRWSLHRGTPADPNVSVYRLDGGGRPGAERSFERVSDEELRLLGPDQARLPPDPRHSLLRVVTPSIPFGGPAAASGGEMPAAMVTDMASGWPLTLRVGQLVVARLAADRAAGGRWSIRAGSDGGIVTREGEPAFEAAPNGGIEIFRLKAVKPGQALLTFDYTLGSAAASRSVSYPLTVQ